MFYVLLPCVLLLLQLPSSTVGFVPRACVHNVSSTPAVCCPVPLGAANACGYPKRGVCRPVQIHYPWKAPHLEWIYKHDLRQYWPKRIFQYLCDCVDQFAGPDCGACRWGWDGPNCQHRVMYKRLNIKSYTPLMKHRFQRVLLESRNRLSDYVWPLNLGDHLPGKYRNMTYQEELVTIHWFAGYDIISRDPKMCKKFKDRVNNNHNGPGFPFWHRYFILLWEYRTRQIAIDMFGWTNFTFPYWDWTNANKCEVCTDDLICSASNVRSPGGGFFLSEKCPLSKWQVICSDVETMHCAPCYMTASYELMNREFITNNYPTNNHVRTLLSLPVYYDRQYPCTGFAEFFEGFTGGCQCSLGIHNMVHMNINGPFNRSRTAANDLLFIFHHTQLDRLFQRWFTTVHPSQQELPNYFVRPSHKRRDNLIGFIPTVRTDSMMVDIRSLGIDYDNYDFGDVKSTEKIKVLEGMYMYDFEACEMKKKNR